jgi:hypothetical protein
MTTPSASVAYPLPRALPPQTSQLATALAAVQAELPPIPKNRTAKVKGKTKDGLSYEYEYAYADLADVSAVIMPLLGRHGLSFTARPTSDEGHFGLAYSLLHSSGEREDGFYPVRTDGSPQQVGGLITYARRYCLCAVTGVAAEEDTDARDSGPAARPQQQRKQRGPRERPPVRPLAELPRNQDGSLSRSRITDEEFEAYGNMTAAQVKEHGKLAEGLTKGDTSGVTRSTEFDDGGQWAASPPLRVPSPAPKRAGVIVQHFERMGIGDREERLGFLSEITGRKVESSKTLEASEGIAVLHMIEKCKDRAALRAVLDAVAAAPEAP